MLKKNAFVIGLVAVAFAFWLAWSGNQLDYSQRTGIGEHLCLGEPRYCQNVVAPIPDAWKREQCRKDIVCRGDAR